MTKAFLLAAAIGLASLGPAAASTITFESRYSTEGSQASAAGYRAVIDPLMAAPATNGYGSANVAAFDNLSNRSALGSAYNDIAFRYTVGFSGVAGLWNFQIGVDFGRGGAVFIDNTPVAYNPGDMWWANTYANADQAFLFSATLGAGDHVMTIYGLEGCCDGGQQGQFRAPGAAGFTTFSATDGHNPVEVPEPGTLLLLGASLLGLGFARQRFQ